MRTAVGILALLLACSLPARAAEGETVGDSAVKAKRSAGKEVRGAGREVKATGRKARQAVITRCADGRHTVRGASGCAAHGGVNDPKTR